MFSFKTVINRIKKVSEDSRVLSAKPRVGHMYCYKYDPKTKDKLPYYDIFPLIIVVDYAKNGFYGINFHYLDVKSRIKILQLIAPMNTKSKNMRKIQISYSILKGLTTTLWKPMFKRYLFSHMKTKIVEMPVKDWKDCVTLPVVMFAKSTAKQIHKDSRNFK